MIILAMCTPRHIIITVLKKNISKVKVKENTHTGGQNVLNKTTLTPVCWALSSQHSLQPESGCFLSCQFWQRGEYQRVLCHGDFEELSVERGKCWAWQETLKSEELCWVSIWQPEFYPPLASKNTKPTRRCSPKFCLCKVCKYARLCVSVCKTPSVQVALSELFSKPGHWRGFVTSLQRCLSQIIT